MGMDLSVTPGMWGIVTVTTSKNTSKLFDAVFCCANCPPPPANYVPTV
jgi:hypothetical protein